MKKIHYNRYLAIFLLFSCLASYYLLFWSEAKHFTIQNHAFRIMPLPFIGLALLLFVILAGVWLASAKLMARIFSHEPSSALRRDFLTYLPLAFLILVPEAGAHYLTRDDLLLRLKLFGLGIIFSILFLKSVNLYLGSKEKASPFLIYQRFCSLPVKKKLIILFFISLLLYNLGSVLLLSGGITLSGDEPHYLLISHSLFKDGDFDLSNNYASRDYAQYMPASVHLHPHLAPETDSQFSFHSPGLSLLLLPFYALGSLLGEGKLLIFIVRLGMSLFGSLLGLQIYLFAFQEWKKENVALLLWFLFGFTTPIFFYSLHLYPEIIAALFFLIIFRLLRFRESFSPFLLLGLGFLLGCFLWLHAVKYIFIFLPLGCYCLWILSKKRRQGWKILYFIAFPLLLTSLLLVFSRTLYGSFSPFSVSLTGPVPPKQSLALLQDTLSSIPLRLRLETLAGYFFDQRDGLLFYAPLYFFAFLGMIEIGRKSLGTLLTIIFLTAPYVLSLAFLTQRTAYAPQARTLAAVFWAPGIFLGYFLANDSKKIFSFFLSLVALMSILLTALLILNPWSLYQPTTAGEAERASRLFITLSNLHFFLPSYLPSFLKVDNTGWLPNYIWPGVLALFLLSYLLAKKHDFKPSLKFHLAWISLGLLAYFAWFVLYPRPALLHPRPTAFPSGEKIVFYALGRVARMVQPGKFLLPSPDRSYVFYFTSWRKIKELQLEFGSFRGEYEAAIDFFDLSLYRNQISDESKQVNLPFPVSYRFKRTNLFRISISIYRKSPVSTSEFPFLFSIKPKT